MKINFQKNSHVWFIIVLVIAMFFPILSAHGSSDLENYSYVDPEQEIPSDLLINALEFFDGNQNKIFHNQHLTVFDFTCSSNICLVYVINMKDGSVRTFHIEETESNPLIDDSLIYTNDPNEIAEPIGGSMEDSILEVRVSKPRVKVAPLWEAKREDGRAWTQFAYDVVNKLAPNLLTGSKDVKKFCPKYTRLNRNQKINFWIYLVSAVVKYESNFNPTSRFLESTMGYDPVTGKRVHSEGLLQLSYQDIRGYPFCEFNWSKDKKLNPNDPKKTIFNPYTNLKCGIQILNKIVGKKKMIAFNAGHYWATLKPHHSAESKIRNLTKTISICRN